MTCILHIVFVIFAVAVVDNSAAGINKPGDCFTEDAPIPLKSGKATQGLKNTKNCTCEQAKALRAPFGGMDWYVPQCDDKGQFKSKQIHQVWGSAWCVDANGNQIGEMISGDAGVQFSAEAEHLRGAAERLRC